MAHHGNQDFGKYAEFNKEFAGQFRTNDNLSIEERLSMLRESQNNDFGATGQFPDGKITGDDEGEIKFGITTTGNSVVMNFGKKIMWVGFTKEQAKEIGELLIEKSKGL